jgi:hypothetical protein
MQVRRCLWILVLALIFRPAASRAADTGSISGLVVDRNGQPIADATATVRGDRLPSGRSVVTGSNGLYQFDYLIPGEYTIQVGQAGMSAVRRTALVEVGRTTQVDVVLGLTVAEEITVAAVQPIVDTRSTEVNFNYKSETLNSLPVDRTYRGLFQMIPGVADNRSPIGPSAGGSRQDSTYLIDGANITSPGFGYLSTEVNQLDISEVNLKRAGISAEFGRTAGSVVNAVSRAGSNQFSGIGRIDVLPTALVAAYKLPSSLSSAGVAPGTFRDALLTSDFSPAAGAGGPVVENRLFFYASARAFRQTKWDRINKVGSALPDEERKGHELYGKLTASATPSHQLTASYRFRPNLVENSGLTSDSAPSVGTTSDNGSRIATAEWSNFMTGQRSVNLRYLYMKENNEDEPATILGMLPPFSVRNLAAMGQYTDPNQANLITGGGQYFNTQNYRRHELRGVFSQYFTLGGTSHAFKAGAGYELGEEVLNRVTNGWGAIAAITQDGVPALRTRYYKPQAAQVGQGRTASIFLQDDVTIGDRTTVNAGVLLNRDAFGQIVAGSGGCPSTVTLKGGAAVYESAGDACTFLRFGFGDEVQPRLGVAYQLRPAKIDKAYANWGRYYNMDQKSSARSLAPTRIFQTQTVFDLNGNVLSDGPLASSTGKMIDPAIKPIYTNEIVLGYSTAIKEEYSLDTFFVSRGMHDFIEDVPSRRNGTAPDSGPYVAANLPCVSFAACQSADAQRTYRAFTVDLSPRFSRKWMGDVSYTWSRFEGNFDLDYSPATSPIAVFNTSSFIQDGPGTNVQDPNRLGPLFEDRPHVFKAFGSYSVNERVSISSYWRVQSGTPWAARARDWEGGVLNFLEPAGSHRNPTWTNLDLMGSYRVVQHRRGQVSVEARLLNVFNNQTQLSTDSQQYLDLRTMATTPYFARYLQANPFFSLGNGFAPPRRLHLAAVVSF